MPSAANGKSEKQVSSENAIADPTANANSSIYRQTTTVMEHKIRNLEKRKSKLESYRDLQNAGKELNADQKTAVAKYDEVTNTLEYSRDLYKTFLGFAAVHEKEVKKQAKKDLAAKCQAEHAKLREILLVQDALNQMGNDKVRDDFLHGRNGAAQLSETELKLLDDIYPAVTPKHEAGNPTAFMNEVQNAAEHLHAIVDGKSKEIFGGTYTQVKEILGKIHESGYFDQVPAYEEYVEEIVESSELAPVDALNHDPIMQAEQVQQLPPLEALSIDSMPPQILQQQPLDQPPIMEQAIPPEQQIYYQQQPQPPRPITEMLGTGSFFFLQESEIDTPPEQIPSQTFTNQTFSAGPPQSIPLPQIFHNMPANMQPQQPVPQSNNNINNNNGIEDVGHKQAEDVHKGHPGSGGNRPPRTGNQPYYQNNNGYTNRPKQNRNAPRPGNRH